MENKLIQWPRAKYWTKAFNPVVGCDKISEGCQNCYAAGVVKRFGINLGDFAPHNMPHAKVPQSGVVFVGNMTDLFGEWVPNSQLINWIFDLPRGKDVVNLILTKRSRRMKEIIPDCCYHWFGVTCENQARADERIPDLLSINVPRRWLSLEPLLGPIDIRTAYDHKSMDKYYCSHCGYYNDCAGTYRCTNCGEEDKVEYGEKCPHCGELDYIEDTCPECGTYPSNASGGYYGTLGSYREDEFPMPAIDWVVVGAESGPNRRECKIEWVESIVNQCLATGVQVFVKQINIDGKLVDDINKFPEHLRIRQIPWKV